MSTFNGKTAVVTGAASGIGLEIARELGRRGARLVLSDIEEPALRSALAEIESEGIEAIAVRTDVSDRDSMQDLAVRAWERFGAVDTVALNAGVVYYGRIAKMTSADWAWLLGVNLWGAIHGVEAFLPRMLASGRHGHMSFTASAGGLSAYVGTAAYGATKAAVIALAEGLRKEHAEEKIGFSVLCPMHVATNIGASNRNRPANLGGPSVNEDAVRRRVPGLHSTILSAEATAKMAVDAMVRGEFYIHTHAEARGAFESRTRDVLDSFDRLEARNGATP